MNMLISAGPTREFIDPVRYLSNCSSGKMGYAVARQARARGHAVRLVSGPVALAAPPGVEIESVVSANDMLAALQRHWDWCAALVMVAAVADWRPLRMAEDKIKKDLMPPHLDLERTPDILATLAQQRGERCLVGFAAETNDPQRHARQKLQAKNLDMVVLNDVGRADSGFGSNTNKVWCHTADGNVLDWPPADKDEVANRIVRWIEDWQRRRSI
jgi:phosphopantothenoylcysteine decarboxylase / phosphopantothenate---cysteine ligase